MTNLHLELSWVVPLFCNGGYAAELIRRTHAAAQTAGIGSEIIFVDDHCPEGSGQEAETGARLHPADNSDRLTNCHRPPHPPKSEQPSCVCSTNRENRP